MIKIAICDTSANHRKLISDFCDMYLENKILKYQVQEYASGESLLAEDFPDVLFLDTTLKNIDGILIKELLYRMRADTRIVFVSDEKEKMLDAFGKNVYAFLPKSIEYLEFRKNMWLIMRDVFEQRNRVFCKNQNGMEPIYLQDIVYIKAYGRYTKIFICGEKNYRLSDKSFGEWYINAENTHFAICHRSYLVNLFYIKKVEKEVELINGEHIPIGEKKRKEFYDSYQMYITNISVDIP